MSRSFGCSDQRSAGGDQRHWSALGLHGSLGPVVSVNVDLMNARIVHVDQCYSSVNGFNVLAHWCNRLKKNKTVVDL